jgi:DNA polymerase V
METKTLLTVTIPFFKSFIECGFPSPAQDYMEEDIDLTKLLIMHPLATFLIRAKGDSLNKANVPHNALLLVDKSLTPKNNDIVVAYYDGGFNAKRLIKNKKELILMPESDNPIHKPIVITEEMSCVIWGVVIQIIIDPKYRD